MQIPESQLKKEDPLLGLMIVANLLEGRSLLEDTKRLLGEASDILENSDRDNNQNNNQ
tara:strand:- start:177 stop:350 length:174 start_codon:yes stop_codon:yes gene_type:complete